MATRTNTSRATAVQPFSSPPNVALGIADRLRDQILSGELKPHARLTQRDLAGRFGISPMPVRDAIKVLISEGLAIQEGSKTIVVAPRSADDFLDIMEVRMAVEPRALELAIPSLSKDDLAYSGRLLRTHPKTPRDIASAHWAFHMSLYRRSGRPRLISIIDVQHLHLMRYLMPSWALVGVSREWTETEMELLALVAKRKIDKAVSYLRADLESAMLHMLRAMPAEPPQGRAS